MRPGSAARQHRSSSDLGENLHRLVTRAESFWQRLTEGMEIQELWSEFKADARASYEFYSREVDWEVLASEPVWKRRLKIVRAMIWAMVLKLSPARRVFLFLSVALVVLAWLNANPLGWPLAVASLLLLLALELADRIAMKRDLEIASEIQSWLVPKAAPYLEHLDIAFATRPANTVAGDYYDAFLCPSDRGADADDRLLLVVADVVGKSVPAALLMATFQASLRTLAATPLPLVDLVEGLNRYACAHSLGGRRFTTAFIAELDTRTRALTYVGAGHNPPIVRRASGAIERLEGGGLPLGIQLDAVYGAGSAALGTGDLLLIFTDGVVEAEDEAGAQYGETRLLDHLRAKPPGTAADSLARLMTSLDQFVGRARQHDDITCLVLRVA